MPAGQGCTLRRWSGNGAVMVVYLPAEITDPSAPELPAWTFNPNRHEDVKAELVSLNWANFYTKPVHHLSTWAA